MNKRINDLFDKALDEVVPNTWTNLTMDQLNDIKNKFAELIVQECMACSTWVGKMNTNSDEPIHTAHAVNQRIKQHFGVEE